MANLITQTQVMTNIARMMGKRSLPQGDLTDWEDYAQFAFDYAWRYYKWDWSLRRATVDFATDIHLPADFDLGGYRKALGDTNGDINELTLEEYSLLPSAERVFTLEYDDATNSYKVVTASGLTTMDFIYQVKPPTLSAKDDDNNLIPVPFPSAMTIAIGASVYSKQGENPTRADISQEWDEWHAELDRHVGRMENNKARQRSLNLQDYYGTYTGDTR